MATKISETVNIGILLRMAVVALMIIGAFFKITAAIVTVIFVSLFGYKS